MRHSDRALLLCAEILAGVLSVGIARATVFGINYDVAATDTSQIANCKTDPNATVHQKFALPRYGSPAVRQSVHGDLNRGHESGFEVVRTIVQLFPGQHPSGDLIDTGKIDQAVLASISGYIRDARDAGFKQLILAFATQGPASAICRKRQWGDCFDQTTIPATVEAEAKIIETAHSIMGISLRVDLLNEGCMSDAAPKTANGNFARLVRALTRMHASRFPEIPATVSCQIERAGDGLSSVKRLFAKSGDHVGFFDIHAYPLSAHTEAMVLAQAAESLKGTDTPIILGETTYADPEYRKWITESYRASFHHDPPEILFWPLHSMSSHCDFDVAQPYLMKDALGNQ